MKSEGSFCRYKDLFSEHSAPSLSGMIFHNTVNVYTHFDLNDNQLVDWPYKSMREALFSQAGEVFEDSYSFLHISLPS